MDLLRIIKDNRNPKTNARNSMGCSENWYNSYYAIANTFTDDELNKMSEEELKYLIKLADTLSEAFY